MQLSSYHKPVTAALLWITLSPQPIYGQVNFDSRSIPPQPPFESNFLSLLTPLLIICGLIYLLMIKPEQKKQQKLQELQDQLKVGDRIVVMGIVGTVHKLTPETVILKTGEEGRIELLKQSMQELTITKQGSKH